MNAIIRIGSHQYVVEPGASIRVQKLDGSVGSEVRIKDILCVCDGKTVRTAEQAKGTVIGRITAQSRGPKIIVFKKKRRKGYTRTIGHRQAYTRIEITKIEG